MPTPAFPTLTDATPAALCVLASGSSGNCSVLLRRSERGVRGTLIDAGLSPRRTRRLLAQRGTPLRSIDEILLTHLDSDHFHAGWMRELDRGVGDLRATLLVHERHAKRLASIATPPQRTEYFDDTIHISGARVDAALLSHDQLGVAAFRFDFDGGENASLGFATDVGRPTDELVTRLHGVSTLAIESNYCPVLQRESPRPGFLKARIMGGSGHLSNEQCARTVKRIVPRERVVLLHLSRQCNTPERASAAHLGEHYETTVTDQHRSTGWIPISAALGAAPPLPAPLMLETLPLFGERQRSDRSCR